MLTMDSTSPSRNFDAANRSKNRPTEFSAFESNINCSTVFDVNVSISSDESDFLGFRPEETFGRHEVPNRRGPMKVWIFLMFTF